MTRESGTGAISSVRHMSHGPERNPLGEPSAAQTKPPSTSAAAPGDWHPDRPDKIFSCDGPRIYKQN